MSTLRPFPFSVPKHQHVRLKQKIAPPAYIVMLKQQVADKIDDPSQTVGAIFSLNLVYKRSFTVHPVSIAPLIQEIETKGFSSHPARIICFVCYLLSQHGNIGNFLSQPHMSVQL